jgi:hypothetical protein
MCTCNTVGWLRCPAAAFVAPVPPKQLLCEAYIELQTDVPYVFKRSLPLSPCHQRARSQLSFASFDTTPAQHSNAQLTTSRDIGQRSTYNTLVGLQHKCVVGLATVAGASFEIQHLPAVYALCCSCTPPAAARKQHCAHAWATSSRVRPHASDPDETRPGRASHRCAAFRPCAGLLPHQPIGLRTHAYITLAGAPVTTYTAYSHIRFTQPRAMASFMYSHIPQVVGIVGAGQMGTGIAQVCAMKGLDVIISDRSAGGGVRGGGGRRDLERVELNPSGRAGGQVGLRSREARCENTRLVSSQRPPSFPLTPTPPHPS